MGIVIEAQHEESSFKIAGWDFIFSHDKSDVTNEHVGGSVRKYSSTDKDSDPEQAGEIHKGTGRFETGFMRTLTF